MNKPPKIFAVQEISFLGHRVSPSGAATDPDLRQATRHFPFSEIRKCTARFLRMVKFHHIFISNSADTAASLDTFNSKVVKFFWNEV
jgi:hypothetical protein